MQSHLNKGDKMKSKKIKSDIDKIFATSNGILFLLLMYPAITIIVRIIMEVTK